MSGPDHVVITFEGQEWRLTLGHELTIGRGRGRDIRLPQDDHLSRHAATVRALTDCLLICNESEHKPFVVRPPVGEDRVVEPGAATASKPFRRFALVFAGDGGTPVRVEVDARALHQASRGQPTRSTETLTSPVRLTRAQRRVLAALCEPMLTRSGPGAAPATYARVGARLSRQPQYVRNVVKALREELAGYGIPDLIGEDTGAGHDDFRWALARWAIRSRWVDSRDLADLPDETKADADDH